MIASWVYLQQWDGPGSHKGHEPNIVDPRIPQLFTKSNFDPQLQNRLKLHSTFNTTEFSPWACFWWFWGDMAAVFSFGEEAAIGDAEEAGGGSGKVGPTNWRPCDSDRWRNSS